MAKERPLSSKEIQHARTVFGSALKYDMVIVSDNIGWSGRSFTTPTINPLQWGHYFINMGPVGYRNLLVNSYWKQTFIHELVHVWQGQHSLWAWNYVFNSVWHQTTEGLDTYNYQTNKGVLKSSTWQGFNVEQQAYMVEQWFADGMVSNTKDKRYRFVRDNIRTGRN